MLLIKRICRKLCIWYQCLICLKSNESGAWLPLLPPPPLSSSSLPLTVFQQQSVCFLHTESSPQWAARPTGVHLRRTASAPRSLHLFPPRCTLTAGRKTPAKWVSGPEGLQQTGFTVRRSIWRIHGGVNSRRVKVRAPALTLCCRLR